MNTQTQSAMELSTSSVHFTGQPICAQALPIPFGSNLDMQFGMSEAIRGGSPSRFKLWMNRIGIAGFTFFLVKGLVWLAIFTFGADAIRNLFS
jgi:hypothetical protein